MKDEDERVRRTFSELCIEMTRLLDKGQGQRSVRPGVVVGSARGGRELGAMFSEAMRCLEDALVGWDEANGRIVEAHTKGFLAGMKTDTLTRVQTGLEMVRVLCEAQTVVGENIVRCNMPNTHPGAHRAELSDGRRFRWEPTTMMSDFE